MTTHQNDVPISYNNHAEVPIMLVHVFKGTLPENDTKRWRLSCYNTYVDFLSHLYEFYLGFTKRGSKFKQQGFYKDYPPFVGKKDYQNRYYL